MKSFLSEVLGVIREQLALVETLACFSATVSREITCSTADDATGSLLLLHVLCMCMCGTCACAIHVLCCAVHVHVVCMSTCARCHSRAARVGGDTGMF